MTTKEMVEVMQAYERGEQIEYRENPDRYHDLDEWEYADAPVWDWYSYEYRVKSQPTYRPYKNAEEFLAAQKEHGMWLKIKQTKYDIFPVCVSDKFVYFMAHPFCATMKHGGLYSHTFGQLLEKYLWQDGTPCGVKEE